MWPFRKEPKPDEIAAAIRSAERDMEPNPLENLDSIERGSWIGNLVYVGAGCFIDFADVTVMSLHPSDPEIVFRNGMKYKLSKHGAKRIAEQIIRMQKGRS